MTYDPNNHPRTDRPIREAIREARAIIILAFSVAIVYNIFAPSPVPWIREPEKSTATPLSLDSLGISDSDTGSALMTTPPVDTTAEAMPVDTAVTEALTQVQRDSLERFRRDSVRLAREEAKRLEDSARTAQFDAVVAKLVGVSEIQTDVAKFLFDSKKALFIDARPEDQYNSGHIRGARNVYAEQWQTKIPELVQIDRDQLIVTYCGGGDECELSHDLANNMKAALGFKTVVVYKGGITDWKAKKYPIATSE